MKPKRIKAALALRQKLWDQMPSSARIHGEPDKTNTHRPGSLSGKK